MSAPKFFACLTAVSSWSIPVTKQPANFPSCTTSCPITPNPTIPTCSPNTNDARLTNCNAIAPNPTILASRKCSFLLSFVTRFSGLQIKSIDCWSIVVPATKSPGRTLITFFPTAIT